MRFFLAITFVVSMGMSLCAFDPSEQDDSMAILRVFQQPSQPVGEERMERKVIPGEGETISLIGGTEVFQMRKIPDFEIALQLSFSDHQLTVRNLGWSADTVYRQQRPMFFFTEEGDQREGSVPDGRSRVEPGLLILFFGKMESLDGKERLDEFVTAYDRLVVQLKQLTGRIVLVSPVPFSETGPAGELAEKRNETLALYTSAISNLAEQHGLVFFNPGAFDNGDYGRSGIHLSDSGLSELSQRLVRFLGGEPGADEALEALVREKDQLWDQYYRPTNWAFLYGDRQHVPSSRDHRDANRRWFEEELESIPPLLESNEAMIWQAAKGGQR